MGHGNGTGRVNDERGKWLRTGKPAWERENGKVEDNRRGMEKGRRHG
jgi:hypothetical protein